MHWTSVRVFWSPIRGVGSNPTLDKVFHWSQPLAPLSDSDHFPLVTYMTLKRVFHKLFKDIFSDFRFDFFHFRSKQFQAWISPSIKTTVSMVIKHRKHRKYVYLLFLTLNWVNHMLKTEFVHFWWLVESLLVHFLRNNYYCHRS